MKNDRPAPDWLRFGRETVFIKGGQDYADGTATVMLSDQWFDPADIHFALPDPASLAEIRVTVAGLADLAVKRGIGLRLL